MMKNNKYSNKRGWFLLLPLVLVLLWTCTEEIRQQCDEGNNIILSVEATYTEVCEGQTNTVPAADAQVLLIRKYGSEQVPDTFLTASLDAEGKGLFEIPDSKCGINNIKVVSIFNSKYQSDSTGFLCCDTLFRFNTIRPCEETVETEVRCDQLDTLISLNLSTLNRGCLLMGSKAEDIRFNLTEINSSERVRIDLSPVQKMNGKFYATISSAPDASGFVELGTGKPVLSLAFYVRTETAGQFDTTLVLPTRCLDATTGNTDGNITIKLKAEVCDDACNCPFSASTLYKLPQTWETVPIGSSKDFTNEFVFQVDPSILQEGCYLQINKIERFPGGSPANTITQQAIHDWTITSPATFPVKLVNGNAFTLSARFEPDVQGASLDTFLISASVYNENDVMKTDSCQFKVSFGSIGCQNICPVIVIADAAPASLHKSNGTTSKLILGQEVPMSPADTIRQKVTGILGSMCASSSQASEKLFFGVKLPLQSGEAICSAVNVKLTLGGVDASFFEINQAALSLSNEFPELVQVKFNTPNIEKHITSKHSSLYKASIKLQATDNKGNAICSQEIKVETEVKENSIKFSEPTQMMAFSQTSDKSPEPAYMAYRIDAYNLVGMYYGSKDNLKPELGQVDTLSEPPVPTGNVAHSFFFEVNDPKNINLLQKPENLSLVNSLSNGYTHISSKPVARYGNPSEFKNDIQNLVNTVFKTGSFTSRGNPPYNQFQFTSSVSEFYWSPFTTAAEMSLDKAKRVKISKGEVYVIWNRFGGTSGFNFNNLSFKSYCEVAFLYIDGIMDGADISSEIGIVSFYVAYPLSTIRQ